jgi:hypothetical protein
MKRYAIVARDQNSGNVVAVCECDSNPEKMLHAVRHKRQPKPRREYHAYVQARIVDREATGRNES